LIPERAHHFRPPNSLSPSSSPLGALCFSNRLFYWLDNGTHTVPLTWPKPVAQNVQNQAFTNRATQHLRPQEVGQHTAGQVAAGQVADRKWQVHRWPVAHHTARPHTDCRASSDPPIRCGSRVEPNQCTALCLPGITCHAMNTCHTIPPRASVLPTQPRQPRPTKLTHIPLSTCPHVPSLWPPLTPRRTGSSHC
jgi:hypothetical protein